MPPLLITHQTETVLQAIPGPNGGLQIMLVRRPRMANGEGSGLRVEVEEAEVGRLRDKNTNMHRTYIEVLHMHG